MCKHRKQSTAESQPVIVIEVKGGCVQEVFANAPVQVVVRDYDNIGVGDADPLQGRDLAEDKLFHAVALN